MKKEQKKLYGPSVLIAGSSVGLGTAFARECASSGLNLLLIDYNKDELALQKKSLLAEFDIEIESLVVDLTEPEAAGAIINAFGHQEVGLFVYIASKSNIGNFHQFEWEDHVKLLNINILNVGELVHFFGRSMKIRKQGGIILISSISALQGSPMFLHYAATKSWTLTLGEGLWDEMKPYGVDVIVSVAGEINTPQTTARNFRKDVFSGKMLEPEQLVTETMKCIGKKPRVIPGFGYRFSVFFLQYFFSRKRLVLFMGRTGRKLISTGDYKLD